MEEIGSNKEFIDEEIITIICDAIKNVFDLTVKFENSETNIVEVTLQNEKEKNIYENLFYNNAKSTTWCNQLIDFCLKGLIRLEKPYKYVVTCVMLQNTGKPFCSLGCGFFEETDGAVSKTIGINDLYFCVSIYGLAI